MTQYLLTIYQPDGPSPDAETMAGIAAELHTLNEQLRASGSWVFTGGPARHRTPPPSCAVTA